MPKRHDGLPNIRTKTLEFPRVPVTLLTRTRANQAFLPYNLLHHPEEKKSPVREETRKDPSDIWFSCGEECVSESPKPMPVQQPMFQHFKAHREPENECSFLTDAKVMPRCESTVLNASPGRGRPGSAVSRKDSCIMEESHSPHQPQSANRWNLQPVHSSPIRRGSQRLRHRENRKGTFSELLFGTSANQTRLLFEVAYTFTAIGRESAPLGKYSRQAC